MSSYKKHLNVPMDAELMEYIDNASTKRGLTKAGYVRMLIINQREYDKLVNLRRKHAYGES